MLRACAMLYILYILADARRKREREKRRPTTLAGATGVMCGDVNVYICILTQVGWDISVCVGGRLDLFFVGFFEIGLLGTLAFKEVMIIQL